MALELVTAASVLPVSRDAAKVRLSLVDGYQDALVDDLLASACARVAEITGQPMGAASWRLWLDEFSDAMALPRWPVSAVSAVQYIDEAGVTQTADSALYTLDAISRPAWVVLNEDEDWPETMDRVNAVSISFTAGWTEATLPADLRGAVLSLVAHWFENRGDMSVPAGVDAALFAHRRITI